MDAGCEWHGYAADISRTFAVGGDFNAEQTLVYGAVHRAQQAALAALRPGNTLLDAHNSAAAVLVEAMADAGLLRATDGNKRRLELFERFFPHRTSHWLGLDVHDVGAYGETDGSPRRLQSGMVLTVEPGLYLQPDDDDLPAQWRGIGVRIEDDALITDQGAEWLNPTMPVLPADVARAAA